MDSPRISGHPVYSRHPGDAAAAAAQPNCSDPSVPALCFASDCTGSHNSAPNSITQTYYLAPEHDTRNYISTAALPSTLRVPRPTRRPSLLTSAPQEHNMCICLLSRKQRSRVPGQERCEGVVSAGSSVPRSAGVRHSVSATVIYIWPRYRFVPPPSSYSCVHIANMRSNVDWGETQHEYSNPTLSLRVWTILLVITDEFVREVTKAHF